MSSERDEKAEKQAEGARSAINYMTKWENYIEGYERGWDAALESEQVRKLVEAVKYAGCQQLIKIGVTCRPHQNEKCKPCEALAEWQKVKGK